MKAPKDIAIEEYDYALPNERIAKFPLANRDESKLLVYKNNSFEETIFNRLPDYLNNDTLFYHTIPCCASFVIFLFFFVAIIL